MGMFAHGVFGASRRVRVVAAVFAVAVGAVLTFLIWHNLAAPGRTLQAEAQKPRGDSAGSTLAANADANKDSDGDGLKDWEEAIWQTDPQNPDTDGDGTPDGKEVAGGRDPLKKGPNDKLPQPAESVPAGAEPSTDNLTYNLTKNVLDSGVLGAIDENGNLTSTDFLKNISLPKTIDPVTLLQPSIPISAKDLVLAPQNDPGAVKQYFNSLYAVYARYVIPHQKRGDLIILADALQTGDYTKLTELDSLIKAIELTVRDIEKIPTPPDCREFAVRELGYLLETKRAMEIFRNTPNDPLASALIVKPRTELFLEMARFHQETKAALDAKGIVFSNTEGGYAYFQ